MSVIVSNLTKIYGTQRAVDNISFEVKQGEILGLLGPNGAGKSTTMKIATCYVPPTSGTVTLSGCDVTTQSMEVRKHVGYLPEHNPLYLDMYVHEYLHFIGSLHGMRGNTLHARTRQMIDITGLGIEQNKKIGVLSKGYRQRVGLAQAMIHEPAVLILDEPTTGLDPNQIVEIRNLIKNIGKEKTVILSTHIMQEVQAICDRIVIINAGKIVANNAIDQLKQYFNTTRILIAEFQFPIDISLLAAIQGVSGANHLDGNKYEIFYGETDIRSLIFAACQAHGWVLLGMTQKETSLEDIFSRLTQ